MSKHTEKISKVFYIEVDFATKEEVKESKPQMNITMNGQKMTLEKFNQIYGVKRTEEDKQKDQENEIDTEEYLLKVKSKNDTLKLIYQEQGIPFVSYITDTNHFSLEEYQEKIKSLDSDSLLLIDIHGSVTTENDLETLGLYLNSIDDQTPVRKIIPTNLSPNIVFISCHGGSIYSASYENIFSSTSRVITLSKSNEPTKSDPRAVAGLFRDATTMEEILKNLLLTEEKYICSSAGIGFGSKYHIIFDKKALNVQVIENSTGEIKETFAPNPNENWFGILNDYHNNQAHENIMESNILGQTSDSPMDTY
ncbi:MULTISPECIES: hypothetical protein [unclassified Candidatus Tisiphia]|uniref:hypothetical protein n=1 Tax=unclassified Candidatus Tisiphia TaxID=2996318 RepID=UPI0035C90F2D